MQNSDIEKVIDLLKQGGLGRGSTYERFFNKIKDQIWIKPLLDEGFFKKPTEKVKTDDGISFPFWVESKYLARATPFKGRLADLIVEIVLTWETDNERVHEDIVDIIKGLPNNKIAPLLDKEIVWIDNTKYIYMSLPQKYKELVNHLISIGSDDYALKFAQCLLKLSPDPKPIYMGNNYYSRTPQTKFIQYQFEEIVRDAVINIYKNNPLITVGLLCGLLNQWIEFSGKTKDTDKYHDSSYIWRPQIGKSDDRRTYEISDSIINALTNLTVEYLENNPKNTIEINNILEKYSWSIFKRISMYLLRKFPNRMLLEKYLINSKYFIDISVQNEYAILLKYRYNELEEKAKNKLLEWVDNGPDVEFIKKNHMDLYKKPITESELNERITSWKKKRLLPFYNSLTEKLKENYSTIVGPITEVRDEDFMHFRSSKTWVGPTSPYSVDELKDKSIEEIIKLIKKWKPTEENMAPSPEGLGRVLTSLVATKTKEVSREARRIIGLEPNYVRGFISGLNDQVKNNKEIYWLPVLELCKWVIKQPTIIAGRDQLSNDWDNFDVNWGWTRKRIADLLGNGLSGHSTEIPLRYRDKIWDILSVIIEDSDPTIDREIESYKDRWDPFTESINCTRGEAMHSLIQYGLWCKRSIEAKRKKQFSFEDAKELEKKLDLHLDHRHEKSLAVHSVYGYWVPWLLLMDQNWTISNIKKIFPLRKNKYYYWKAAWLGYINFRSPYNNVLKYLNRSYHFAIKQTQDYDEDNEQSYLENHHNHLAEHLIVYYWRNKLDLTQSGLIHKYFNTAPQELRSYAINFVGRSLRDYPGTVEEEFLNPFIKLWDWRINEFKGSSNPNEFIDELSNFGAWFESGKLDNEWSLNQLKFVLENCKKLTDKNRVFKQLSRITLSNPIKVIKICKSIINLKLKPWDIYSWKEELREILKQINEQGSKEDKMEALELIGILGSLGQFDYQDLWETMKN